MHTLATVPTLAGRIVRRLTHTIEGARPARPVDISDEYVNWLCFANAGMLDRGNLYCFDYAMENLPSGAPVVEIGSFCGLSTNLLTYYKRRRGRTNPLVTCDRWVFEGSEKETAPGGSANYREFVRDSFVRNVRQFSGDDLPYTVELFSDEFFDAWREGREERDVFGRRVRLGGPIGFCYIDGNHSYEYARRDFDNADEFLEPGGFLLFDDSADGSGWEVCQVVAEVQESGRYDLIIKNPNYLFRKR